MNMSNVEKRKSFTELREIAKGFMSHLVGIKWTNRHECPNGYEFNDEGWVQTTEKYLQVDVNMLPYIISGLGERGLLYQNAVALRYLNSHSSDVVKMALRRKFIFSYMREPDTQLLNEAVDAAFAVDSLKDVLGNLSRDIFKFHDIWYRSDCSFEGRKQIQAIIKQRYIEDSRKAMGIDTKYKTKCVMEFAGVTEYSVKKHWRLIGLDKNGRTGRAILDAIEYYDSNYPDKQPTQEDIAKIAGVSLRTVKTHVKVLDNVNELKSLR